MRPSRAERPTVSVLYIYTNIGDAILMPSRKTK